MHPCGPTPRPSGTSSGSSSRTRIGTIASPPRSRTPCELVDAGPRVPLLKAWKPVEPEVREATEEFLRLEKEDARELKRLAKELRDAKDTTIWHLLVTLMEADTAKHIHILTFLRDHQRTAQA